MPLGSFKLRGGLNFVASLSPERARPRSRHRDARQSRAVAGLARRSGIGVSCAVFVPAGNNPDKNTAIAALGATRHASPVTTSMRRGRRRWTHAAEHWRDRRASVARAEADGGLRNGRARDAGPGVAAARHGVRARRRRQPRGRHGPRVQGTVAAHPRHRCAKLPRLLRSRARGTRARCAKFPSAKRIADGLATRVPSRDTVAILREVLDDMIEVSEAEIVGAIRCSPKRCTSSPKARVPRRSPARCSLRRRIARSAHRHRALRRQHHLRARC